MEAPQNLPTCIDGSNPRVSNFFLPLCTYCCFSLSFFPPLLSLTLSLSLPFCPNTLLLELRDLLIGIQIKRCTDTHTATLVTQKSDKHKKMEFAFINGGVSHSTTAIFKKFSTMRFFLLTRCSIKPDFPSDKDTAPHSVIMSMLLQTFLISHFLGVL